jgi:predicted nuclease of predicted toxin-antitoxin system
MRILFDQNVPRKLRDSLAAHEVVTALQAGWDELKNGDLLRVAQDADFDVMITADQNLRYQQNLSARKLAIVMLTSNDWRRVQRHLNEIKAVVEGGGAGDFVELNCAV